MPCATSAKKPLGRFSRTPGLRRCTSGGNGRRGRAGGQQHGKDPTAAYGYANNAGSRRGREPRDTAGTRSSDRTTAHARPCRPKNRGAQTPDRQLWRPHPWDAFAMPGAGTWENPHSRSGAARQLAHQGREASSKPPDWEARSTAPRMPRRTRPTKRPRRSKGRP